ncbi:uncharacterized protein LTR77_008796 [Saxophila tyrrhenica]|uniref:Heterokaryon incompatibility domain-containing protein n=1 Tax=Saxophila tyrrhenica TaxID=1690608 RepID=A0AAV9P3K5_9PEZI|nr:hypothetical protein LTR77_008796 [Saxophila tyrrhenica]
MDQAAELCSGCRIALEESYRGKTRTYVDIADEDWDNDYDFEIRRGFEMARELIDQKSDSEPFKGRLSDANMDVNIYFADEYEDREAFFRVSLLSLSTGNSWPDSYEPTPGTGDENTFELIKYWTDVCLKQHSSCHGSGRWQWAPTRLIHVRRDGEKGIFASLHEAALEDYPSEVDYLVLSHRWLSNEPLRLLKKNHNDLRNEIPLDSLKPAIQEATDLCLRLDTAYIWIDTLCILQDDPGDLDRELAEMHRIYGNARCTIAAAVTNGGCFSTRDTQLTRNNIITLTLAGETLRYRLKVHWGQINGELQSCILGKRAWIFQERFLSPRILHFCDRLVHWECRELEASEVYPKGKPPAISANRHRPFHFDAQDKSSPSSTALSLPPWDSIVSNYTDRSLTFPADRLKALSGVAAYCAALTGDEYLYGLWRKTIPVSLLWGVVASEQEPVKKRLPNLAPSWSWASVSGLVMFSGWLEREHEVLAELVGLENVDDGKSAFQAVVRLCGMAFKGTVQGQLAGTMLTDYLYATSPIVPDATIRVLPDTSDGDMEHLEPYEAYFLPILYVEDIGTDGIILEYLEDAVVPTYRRIGCFSVGGRTNLDEANGSEEYWVC